MTFILDVEKDYNLSNLRVGPGTTIVQGPGAARREGKHHKISYNNNTFMIQTPLCRVKRFTSNDKNVTGIGLSFPIEHNFGHYRFFSALGHTIANAMKPELTINCVEIDESEINLALKITQETLFFDGNKQRIHGFEIAHNDQVVALIETKGIYTDNRFANCRWTAREVLKLT